MVRPQHCFICQLRRMSPKDLSEEGKGRHGVYTLSYMASLLPMTDGWTEASLRWAMGSLLPKQKGRTV